MFQHFIQLLEIMFFKSLKDFYLSNFATHVDKYCPLWTRQNILQIQNQKLFTSTFGTEECFVLYFNIKNPANIIPPEVTPIISIHIGLDVRT